LHATEIKCPRCFAPADATRAISTCRFCGTTIALQVPQQGGAPLPSFAVQPGGGGLSVFLEDAGPNKISVIKAIREGTGLGLKEAKDLVEQAPCVVAECSDLLRAHEFRKKLAAAGARVR
jgi:ribosomal protein L7/L12